MRVTSHAEGSPEHSHGASCSCGAHHSHVRVQPSQTLIGLTFIANSYVMAWLPGFDSALVGISSILGALLLGFPIVWVAMKDLRAGSFNTNLLVALAVLSLVGSAHYQEAGIVSFLVEPRDFSEAAG